MLKKMNKMVFVVVLLMAILVTGCSKPEVKTMSSNKEDIVKEAKEEDASNEDTEKKVEETQVPYEKGVRADTSYESKALNVKFTLPEGFIMATDEEISQVAGDGIDMQEITEAEEAAVEKLIFEMLAQNPVDGSSVFVIAEKLPLKSVEEEEYLQISIDSAVRANTSNGLEVQHFGEPTEEVLGGQTFQKSGMRITINGMPMIQELLVQKVDDHMVTITLSYPEGNEAAKSALTDAFQPLT